MASNDAGCSANDGNILTLPTAAGSEAVLQQARAAYAAQLLFGASARICSVLAHTWTAEREGA